MNIPLPRQGERPAFKPDDLYYISSRLDALSREYIKLYYNRFRKSNKEATEASNKWKARNAELNDYCAQNKYNEAQKRAKKMNDWELSDAMDAWSWHSREAARCEGVIAMELNMIILGISRAQ